MSLVNLKPATLDEVRALIKDPSGFLDGELKKLDPNGHWDLLTHRVSSDEARSGAELTLKLLDRSASDDGELSGGWQWSASAEVDASLSMDLLTDAELKPLPFKPDGQHTMIAYGADLRVGGKLGAGTGTVAWGSAKADASGKRNASLRWYVQAGDGERLFDALVSAQSQFVWPHDIQGMLKMARRKDWFGLACEFDGEAQLAIDVDASAKGTGWTFGIHGDTSSVGLSVGVQASYKASHESHWKLTVMLEKRNGAPGVRVALHDTRQTSQSGSLSISAGADFSAVTASAERALRANWPELDNERLTALTQPGTAVAAELRQLIDDKFDGSLQQLATLLAGGEPTAALRKSLVDKLTLGLADTLDGALGGIASSEAKANEAVKGWLDRLLGRAAATVTLDDDLEAVVGTALKRAAGSLTQAATRLRDDIVGKAQGVVDTVLKRLGELGAQFQDGVAKLDENGVSKAITNALKTYAQRREKLLSQLADGERAKLAMTLAATFSVDTTSEAAFEAWFSAGDTVAPVAVRLYNAVYGGQLLSLPELVQAARGAGVVDDAKGWLLSTRTAMKTQRVALNLFGLQIANNTTWLKDAAIKTDLITGDLVAVKGGGSVETSIANPWKNRSAKLGMRLTLDDTAGAPRQLSASLDGTFTASQEDTDRAKVQDLLNAYADATGAQRNDVGLLLPIPPASDAEANGRFWHDLTIAVPVVLDETQWRTFTGHGEPEILQASLEIAQEQFRLHYLPNSLFSKDPLGDVLDDAGRAGESTILGFLQRFPDPFMPRSLAVETHAARDLGYDVKETGSFDRELNRFMACQRLSATVMAPLRLRRLVASANAVVQGQPARPDPEALRRALDPFLQRIQLALAPVALVSETALGIGKFGGRDEVMTWPFVSFLATIARLAELPPPGFVPVAQIGDKPAVRLIAGG